MTIRTLTSTVIAGLTLSVGALNVVPASATQRGVHASIGAALGHGGRVTFLTVSAERAARKATLAAERLHAHAVTTTILSAHGGANGAETDTGQPKVYVVFYGNQWGTDTPAGGYDSFSGDPQGMAPRLEALYAGLGSNGENWSGVLTQYCDGAVNGATTCGPTATHVPYPSANVLAGTWYDDTSASPSNATGNQLALEANAAAVHFGNTTPDQNRNAQYIIVSPTGTHPDGFNTLTGNFCAYHDYNTDATLTGGGAAPSTYGIVAWTNLPYLTDLGANCGTNYVNAGAAGALDGVTIVAGHEYAESMTDLWATGWYDTTSGKENGDLCAWIGTSGTGGAQNVAFATGTFPMLATWSNATGGCAIAMAPVTTLPFTLSQSTAAALVTQGSAATATVSTAAATAASIALATGGLPTGVTATFSPAIVTAGSSSNLTLATTTSTPAGTYPIVVTGTANGVTQSTSYSLVVTAPGVLGLGLSASNATVTAGLITSSLATPSLSAGPAVATTLSVSGAPTGVTATFAPATVNTGSTSTLTFSTTAATAVGTYPITVTASSGAMTATATYTLTVTPFVAYALNFSSTSGTGVSGAIVTTTLTSAVVTGVGQNVGLSVSGIPKNVSMSLVGKLTAGGSVAVRFTIKKNVIHGTYVINFNGKTKNLMASAVYTLTI